jgi:hypothetical protein
MNLICRSLIVISIPPLISQYVASQETPVPPPPPFSMSGVDAYASPYNRNSSNKVLDAYVGKNNFWRKLAFGMAGDPNKLSIVYWCTAADTQGSGFSEGPFSNNNYCPEAQQVRSRGIQRVKFALAGSEEAKYSVEYECWIGCNNQPVMGTGGQHKAGEWCGVMPPTPDIDCWVGRIAITIQAK